jgi:hypothetical protein
MKLALFHAKPKVVPPGWQLSVRYCWHLEAVLQPEALNQAYKKPLQKTVSPSCAQVLTDPTLICTVTKALHSWDWCDEGSQLYTFDVSQTCT